MSEVQITAKKSVIDGRDKSITFSWEGKEFTIHWEDIEFLKEVREIDYGTIESIVLVNKRVQGFKKPKKSVKIF